MNYYHFEVLEQKFEQKKSLPSLKVEGAGSKAQTSKSLVEGDIPDKHGLKTEFKNDTEKEQTYNFRMEKTRTATVEVNYQKGFSIGGSANFTLGLPKVTKSKGQRFEETLTTEATSEIKVPMYTHCSASIIMEERRLLADFEVRVKMYMPEKKAVVLIKNKTGRTVSIKVINNLSMLFPPDTHIEEDGQPVDDAVMFVIHGFVDGMQLSNHYIHLKSRELLRPKEKTSKSKVVSLKGAAKANGGGGDIDQATDFSDLQELGYKEGF
ncbi:hypothetical protein ACOMHN_039599 [Nucella lapillus]